MPKEYDEGSMLRDNLFKHYYREMESMSHFRKRNANKQKKIRQGVATRSVSKSAGSQKRNADD